MGEMHTEPRQKVWEAATTFLSLTATHIADAATSKALLQRIFEPSLSQRLEVLELKSTDLLQSYQKSHAITYSRDFTKNLRQARSKRYKNEYTTILKSFFGIESLDSVYFDQPHDLNPLVTSLMERVEPDSNRFACCEALDCMEAYYKVIRCPCIYIDALPF